MGSIMWVYRIANLSARPTGPPLYTDVMKNIKTHSELPTVLIHQYFYRNQSTNTDGGRQITENCVTPDVYHVCVDN